MEVFYCGTNCVRIKFFISCIVVLEGSLPKNKLDACVELFVENRLSDTKTYDGCQSCFGAVNKSESVITLWTQWESAEHFDRYLEWRTERGDFAEVLSYFIGEPKMTRSELFFS